MSRYIEKGNAGNGLAALIRRRAREGAATGLIALMVLAGACMGPEPDGAADNATTYEDLKPIVSERIDGQPAGLWATPADYEKATGKRIESYRRSPFLDDRGLPPASECVPEEPLVVKPIESCGKYGGTLRVLTDQADNINIRNFMAPASVLSYDRDYRSVAPGLAKKWEFSPDGRVLTLTFRKGLRWSDGHPFTTDDVMFWWEDVILNDDITPVKPATWKSGGELARMEKIDDWTIRMSFKDPYPVIIYELLIRGGVQGRFFQCKHYMKQFHPKYTDPEALDARVKEAGYDFWPQYYKAIEGTVNLGDPNRMACPTMSAYMMTDQTLQTTTIERNPYYWKVDPTGAQLPYIDKVSAYFVEGKEVFKLKLISGEVDFDMGLYTMSVEDIPTLRANEKNGYETLLWKSGWGGVTRLSFNLTHADPVKREIFNHVEFRRAVSLALDRETMNDSVLFQRGVPCQASVLPDPKWSSFYEPEFSNAYIEYDPEEANRLLDSIGLDKRDRDGYRLMSDGRRLTVILMDHWAVGARGAFFELTTEYLADVGIEMIVKPVDAGFRASRLEDGDFDVMAWHIDGILDNRFVVSPFAFVPVTRATCWGPMWYRWYNSNGAEGEAPPPAIQHLYDQLKIMQSTMDEAERIRAGKAILRSQAENLWTIGSVGYYATPLIASKRLRNVPKVALWTWDCYHTAPLPPEAFYFDDANE